MKEHKCDATTKSFLENLIERNRKIVKCLNNVMLKLSSFQEQNESNKTSGKLKKKLFIFNDDLQNSLTSNSTRKSQIGTIEIQGGASGSSQASTSLNQSSGRRLVSGFLLDEAQGGIDVMLELKEPATQEGQNANTSELLI